jgi:uncharacterized protein (DUF58 family)
MHPSSPSIARLTRSGRGLVLGGCASLVVARLFGVDDLVFLGAAGIALALAAVARTSFARLPITGHRTVEPSTLHAGTDGSVVLEVTARRTTGDFAVDLGGIEHHGSTDTFGDRVCRGISAGTTERFAVPVQPRRRGVLSLGPAVVRTLDPFGLSERSIVLAPPSELLVLPEVRRIAAPIPGPGSKVGEHLARLRTTVGGDEFHAQREYVPGDDLRRVNWKASARRNTLVVREAADNNRSDIRLVVDLALRRPDDHSGPTDRTDADADAEFERTVSCASSIALAAIGGAVPLRVELTDGTTFDLAGPVTGGREVEDSGIGPLLEHLAIAAPHPGTTRHGGSSDPDRRLVAVIVTSGDERRVDELLARVHGPTTSSVVVRTATIADPSEPAPFHRGDFVLTAASLDSFAEAWDDLFGHHAAGYLTFDRSVEGSS